MTSAITIAVAPNGGRRSKTDHPAIPITVDEIARVAAESLDAGAGMIHAHIRDASGRHLLDAETYRQAIAAIRRSVGDRLVIQITSESIGQYAPSEQIAVIKATRPEAVSLAVRELVPDPDHEGAFADFLAWLHRSEVTPQVILYSVEDARRLGELVARGFFPWRSVPVLFVLGSYQTARASVPGDLEPFLAADLPTFAHWMICAFGRNEAACLIAAARRGGHVRVGFENNLHQADGSVAISNSAQVHALAQGLRAAWAALR
jgi:3-keto-5-aminohexanoate cleavage enzyme